CGSARTEVPNRMGRSPWGPWGLDQETAGGRGKLMSVITLTINGQGVSCPADHTILEVARENGIRIPTLCYLDGLSAYGGCRLCLVEIAGSSRLQPACVMQAAEGMEVQTDTPRLLEYRRM